MLKIYKYLVLLVVILVSNNLVFGQRKLTVKEFWDLYYAAENKLENILHRKITENTSSRGSQIYARKEIYEFIPPNKSRTVTEDKNPEGLSITQFINIGSKTYIKQGKGRWIKLSDSPSREAFAVVTNPSKSDEGKNTGEIESNSKFMFAGNTLLNGQEVGEYSFNSINRYSTTKITFYINKKNLLVKRIDYFEAGDFIREASETYEYNVKIKIQAPIK